MGNAMTFGEVLESIDRLSLDEQEAMMDVLHRRIIEHRRLAKEIKKAQQEFGEDKCKPTNLCLIWNGVLPSLRAMVESLGAGYGVRLG